MRTTEKAINNFLKSHSQEFLKRLKNYVTKHSGHNQRDNKVAARLMMLYEKVQIAGKKFQSVSNGRNSKFDLYYESQNLTFIIELKLGKVGFRGVAQAAYYSTCISDRQDCVVLIAEEKGPDFEEFISKCMTENAWRNVIFLRYKDIGLNITTHPTWIASKTV